MALWLHRWGANWEMEAAPHPPLDVRIVSQHDGEARPAQPSWFASCHPQPLQLTCHDCSLIVMI